MKYFFIEFMIEKHAYTIDLTQYFLNSKWKSDEKYHE